MTSHHATIRLAERIIDNAERADIIAKVEAFIGTCNARKSYAVRVARNVTRAIGDPDIASNGQDMWIIIRDNEVATVFYRRRIQSATRADFMTDIVKGTL